MNQDENDLMNRLQDHGLVSDNAVSLDDVSVSDLKSAIENLEQLGWKQGVFTNS